MKKLKKGDCTGYRIADTEEGYYDIVISDEELNETRYYEYSSTCAPLEEVEKYLKEHTYLETVRHYRDMCVYCECMERIQ